MKNPKRIKTSFRLEPITVELIKLLKKQGHYRSDAEIIDWAVETLAGEEGLHIDEIRYEVYKNLGLYKNLEENKNL